LLLGWSLATFIAAVLVGLAWITSVQSRSRKLTARIAALTESSARLADEGRAGLAAQLAILAYRFDPDGKLGMESRVYAVLRRSLASEHFSQTVGLTGAAPSAVSISGNGRMLAIGRSDGSLEVLALSGDAGQVMKTSFRDVGIRALAFLPDDRTLAVGRDDGEVWLVAIDARELRSSILGDCGTIEALAASPGGRVIAAGTQSEGVCLLDPTKPNIVTRREVQGVVRALGFSADGRWLAAGGKGGVALWAASGDAVSSGHVKLKLLDETVTALAFSATRLAVASHADFGVRLKDALVRKDSGGEDLLSRGFLRIWSMDQLERSPPKVPADTQRVLSLSFSRGGETLASGGVDGGIRIWNVADPTQATRQLLGHRGAVLSVAFDPNGERLVSAGTDGSVRAWRLVGPPDGVIQTDAAVLSVAFLGPRRLAAAVRWDQAPLIVDIPETHGAPILTAAVTGTVKSVATDELHPGRLAIGTGSLLASNPDAGVRVWDLVGKRLPSGRQVEYESDVDALAFNPTGQWLVSAGSLDKVVKLLDTRRGQVREIKLPEPTGAIHAVALNPRGDPPLIAVGGDGLVVIVDPVSDRQALVLHSFGGPSADWPVLDLEFSPDGASLATTAPDGKVRLWGVGEWARPQAVLEPSWSESPVAVRQIAYNRGTGELAVGYQDGAVRVWQPREAGRRPLLVNASTGPAVQSLAYDPTGAALAAGFATGGIEVWSSLQSLLELGCAQRLGDLTLAEWRAFVGNGVSRVQVCPPFAASAGGEH
jgi:WD40 repeat protein